MRLTNKLCAQHLGWTFKKHWQVQGKRIPTDTGAAAALKELGVSVKAADDVVAPPKLEHTPYDLVGYKPKPLTEDATHPDWHNQVCHVYGKGNILLEGVPQAQVLTKTIEISGFPKNIEELIMRAPSSSHVDRAVQNAIMASHVFDAEQVKLPKIKLPERPAYNLSREYGISHARRHRLLVNKLIFECEKLAGRAVTSRRRFVDNADFNVTLPRNDDLVQFGVCAEKLITSNRALEPVKGKFDGELPDLYPIKCTVTIPRKHIYTTNTSYPLNSLTNAHPHTIFLHFDKEFVGNLHGTAVSTSQFQSRTLLNAFAVAAARAKKLYGEAALENLSRPIVVQSIQTDGRTFHFGIFQLNTLSLGSSSGLQNYWFHQPNVDLFKQCGYVNGRPVLEGYNQDVFRCLHAFYNNF